MDNNIVVIGSNGQVASLLKQAKKDNNYIFIGRPDFDICNPQLIKDAFKTYKPKLVVNCSAYTNVEKAEKEIESAFAVNSTAVKNIAKSCKANSIPLIHISTDYVFDGTKQEPYHEGDYTSPKSIYGKSKLAGEIYIRDILPEHVIIRTSWVFSEHSSNFVKTMLYLAKTKENLSIINDQYGCPTSAHSIANVIIKVVKSLLYLRRKDCYGVFHFSNQLSTSWFGFAQEIFNISSCISKINIPTLTPISSEQYKCIAPRPKNSVLDCLKIEKVFGIKQELWIPTLEEVILKLLHENK
ncbi:MAG: dTDP-4-dehydrorhamnose reductase [Rickettsiaceae bacterium]